MDGLMLLKWVSSTGLAVGRDAAVRRHHPGMKVASLGPRAASAGGGSAVESSAAVRQSYMFPLRLRQLWPGGGGAVAEKGSEDVPAAEGAGGPEVPEEEQEATTEHRGDSWVMKILRVKSMLAEREELASTGDREAAAAADGDRCVGCSGAVEDGLEGCTVEDEEEEKMVFDRESFSRLLRRVSLVEAEIYAKMAYLCNLAYIVSNIKTKNLLRCYGLRFVTSSLEKKGKSVNSDEEQEPPKNQELKQEVDGADEDNKKKGNSIGISASAAYQIAASAASYLQSQTAGILSRGAAKTEMVKHPMKGSSENEMATAVSPEELSFVATTDSVTAVVAGKEEMKQAIAKELNSAKSLPCEWYICDDDKSATRYFVIQGSETLASWQTNLLFEPVQFEGLDVPVHRGIYEAAKGMYQQMLPEIRAHLKSHGETATLRFTGHSLGGSLAVLVNLMLLIRGEAPRSSLLPVITFGAPSIMCGGDNLLRKLGLSKYHVQAISMHRDIVPRAFSCNYPDHVAKILKAVNGNFRNHACLKNLKLLYGPMGKLLILQPEETFSPSHQLLPPGSGLYILGSSLEDSADSEKLLHGATLAFLNSPHPLEILSDRCAYGSEGTVYRDHDTNSYLRSVRRLIREEVKLIRKAKREQRQKAWWPLVATHNRHHSSVSTNRSAESSNSTQHRFGFAHVIHGGKRRLKRNMCIRSSCSFTQRGYSSLEHSPLLSSADSNQLL
ncbi:hypothetical protein Cni_G09009 [Canna indica]|uniref:Fungal lipase-type domain-containing protein n=1 Tax=Canna indica TaxID=4628 RepID=A0AAQ3K783_9LILI|nr:hypothetical protein Cni_G09009 [Canna indica]